MFDGFLGTRATLMLDLVSLSMLAVVPVLAVSIYLVKYRQMYALHKRIQLILGGVLLVAVTVFEVDIRLHGWRHLAEPSPYYGRDGGTNWVMVCMAVHLVFAVSTTVLWAVVIWRALRNFPSPPVPGPHSAWHKRWARLAAIDMMCTAVTGWLFYWLAFVA
jgi:putative membrane protein